MLGKFFQVSERLKIQNNHAVLRTISRWQSTHRSSWDITSDGTKCHAVTMHNGHDGFALGWLDLFSAPQSLRQCLLIDYERDERWLMSPALIQPSSDQTTGSYYKTHLTLSTDRDTSSATRWASTPNGKA